MDTNSNVQYINDLDPIIGMPPRLFNHHIFNYLVLLPCHYPVTPHTTQPLFQHMYNSYQSYITSKYPNLQVLINVPLNRIE